MANSFIKNLGKVIYQEYNVLQHDALEESFKNAVTKLPKGTLRTKLTTNYDKYLAALEKKIVKLSEKDSVNKCSRDSDSLEELASLGGRKDVEDHNTVKLVFSLRDKKQLSLPNEEIMKDCSNEQKKKIYDVFLGTVLSRPGVDKSIFQEVIDRLTPLLPDQSSDRKVQFDWFPSMCHVIQLCSRTSPLSVIRVLQLLFAAVAPDVENCILKEKVIRAGKIAGILKFFLNICKMKTDCSKMTPLEEKQYRNLLSALLSYYTDLSCLHSRKLKKKKQFGRQLCGFVSYLLQPWPESLLEVVLQLDMMEEDTVNMLVPLVRQCLLLKPAGQDAQYYLKYMLLVRKVTDSLGSLDTLLEYTVLARNIPAPVGFLDWLQDECPEAMDSMPVEDKKFKKVRVTRYLLREADEELIELLKESLEDPSADAPSVDKMEVEADDTATTTQDSLFFIDKGTSQRSQDPVPKARSRIIESMSEVLTPSKSGKGRLKELHQDEAPSDVTTNKQKSSSKPVETNASPKKKQKLQSSEPEPKQKEKQPANELEPKKKSTIKFGQKEFTETDSDISPQKKASTPGTAKRLQSLVSNVTLNKPVNGNPMQANMLGMGVDEEGQSSLSTSLQSLNGSSTSGGTAWTDDTINTYESDVSDMDANKGKKEEEPESGSVIFIDSSDDESKDENDITAVYVATKVSNESNLAVNDTTLKLSEEKVEETDDEEEKEIHLEISETENEEDDKEKAVDSVKESDEEEEDKDEDKDKDNEQKQKVNAESDSDVFVGSPRKRALNKESVQAKFIGKAIRSRTPKSAEKSAKPQEQKPEGSVSIFSDTSDKEEDEASHVENVRTKSTEEIVTIVEDIKQKLQSSTPRQSKKGNDDSKMFTDDSVESMEEVGNTETEDERKESPSKMNRSNRKSPRKSGSSLTEDVSSSKTTSGRKSSKKVESSDEDIVEIADEQEPDEHQEVTMKNLTPQKMKGILETVKSADLIESATDLSELDDVLEDTSAAELTDNGEKGKEKQKASKVPLDMIVSPKRGGAVNEGNKGRSRLSRSSDQTEDERKVSMTPDSACESNFLKLDAYEIVVSDDESNPSLKEKANKTAEKKTPLKENVQTAQDENKKTPSKEMVMKKTPRKGNDVEVEEGNDDNEILPKIPTPKSAGKQMIQQNVSAKKPRRKSSKGKVDENEAIGNDNDDENFIATSPTQKSPLKKATQENGSAKKTQKKASKLNAEENESNEDDVVIASSPTLKSPSKNEMQQNTSNSARKCGRKSSRDKAEEDESDNEVVLSSHTPKSASKKEALLNGSAKKSLRKSLMDESDELEDESEKEEKTPLKMKSPLNKEKQLSGQKRKLSDKTDKSKKVDDQEQGSACQEEITELLVSPERKKLKTPEKITTPTEVAKQASSQEKQNRRKRGSESDSTEKIMSPKSKTDKEEAKSKSAEKMKTPIQTSKPDADQQEDDSDFVPSSVKKQKNTKKSLSMKSPRTRKAEIVLSDSDSEMEPKVNSVPDIGMHLQDDHNDEDVKTEAKSPHIPKIAETKVSAENKRRSVRRGNIESDIESADSKAEPTKADQPPQRKPRRSVAKVTVVEPPLTPRTTRGRASDMSETDQSDAEARPRRKSVGPRMTTIKEKEAPATTTQAIAKSITPAATHARTPQTKPNVRKLSASTTKKAVQQESTKVGGRKRRLSLSQADSDAASAANSTDSEISFPKQKKGKDPVPTQSQLTTTATRARRQSKVKEDETVDTGPVRRSGRKK